MKLSNRLKQVEQMVENCYSHIWDCCCDHGLLGASLLTRKTDATIHFVDIIPDLIRKLDAKLERFFMDSTWETHCLDVSLLPLERYDNHHLVIIAGVGGDLTAKFVKSIRTRYPTLNIDFLLCPVHHHFSLRQQLIKLDLSLKDEALIKENNRFYEVILATSNKPNTKIITPVGDKIWKCDSAKEYLDQTLNHYQRMQQGTKTDVQHIFEAYLGVKIR